MSDVNNIETELIQDILHLIPDKVIDYVRDTFGEDWVKDIEKLIFAILTLYGIIDIVITPKGKYTYILRTSRIYRSIVQQSAFKLYNKLTGYYLSILFKRYKDKYTRSEIFSIARRLAKEKLRQVFEIQKERMTMKKAVVLLYFLLQNNII